jgi:hypothetical protein
MHTAASRKAISTGQKKSWTTERRALAGKRMRRAVELVSTERANLRETIKETREESSDGA